MRTEILKEAKKIISSPSSWCKGAMARDQSGLSVSVENEDACSWCAMGSIMLAMDHVLPSETGILDEFEMRHGAKELLIDAIGLPTTKSITEWNDESTHEEVMKAFDKAIGRASRINQNQECISSL